MKTAQKPHYNNTARPIKVGLVGAGFAARGFALQTLRTKHIRLAGIANRTPSRADDLIRELDGDRSAIRITDDVADLLKIPGLDAIVEVTGDVAYGANVSLQAINHGKHIIHVNAELDGTLGPILKKKADERGVIYTQADGDQPAVIMNLIREVSDMGLTPRVGGNIKTHFNRYLNPDTQREWAQKNGQSTTLATAAVDGTKLAFEMATVANATGFRVAVRGMHGPKMDHVDKATTFFAQISPQQGGIVDFIQGAQPPFGVFVIATTSDPLLQEYLGLYKMGTGPSYVFYRPYHLCTLEAYRSVIDAVCFRRATLAPGGLTCEVIACAKRDLSVGERIDGIGGFTVYGVIENATETQKQKLLPIGLSGDCTLIKPVAKDSPITYNDVNLPEDRSVDRLYREQIALFS